MLPASILPPSAPRLKLVASMVALFGLSEPLAIANTLTVTSCADTGAGTLRSAVAQAMSTDTVAFDLPSLCNSTISLATEIPVFQPSLHISAQAGSANRITIHGSGSARVLNKLFNGTLYLDNLAIDNGTSYYPISGLGGCVRSAGSISITYSSFSHCTAKGKNAYGGAIFATYNVSLSHSSVTSNNALAFPGGGDVAFGGGIDAGGELDVSNSTISGNLAYSVIAAGGGANTAGGAFVSKSAIYGNVSYGVVGGLSIGAGSLAIIQNSTISSNIAKGGSIGGVYSSAQTTKLIDSTIAFNTAHIGKSSGRYFAPGFAFINNHNYASPYIYLKNTLLSNNTYNFGSTENDFSVVGNGVTPTIVGSNNLAHVATGSLPSAGLQTGCPLLGPLRNNGGATLTHALMSHSPAIDAGVDTALVVDQRGTGFVRPSGTVTDIGAYEVQTNDIVFNATFDGCL